MKTICWYSVLFLCACADGSALTGDTAPAPAREPPAEASPTPEMTPARRVDVLGLVTTDLGEPIVGRPIVLVDELGKKHITTTIERGVFRVSEVAPPYDLAVGAAPSGDVRIPTAFLGLSRSDPTIELFERDGPRVLPQTQAFVLAVAVPPCAGSGCVVTAASASAHGRAVAQATYEGAPAPIRLILEHGWTSARLTDSENVDVHVLVADAARTTFAFAQRPALVAAPGMSEDLGVVVPEPVPVSGPVAITVDASALPSSWRESIAVHLDLPGGPSFPLFEGAGVSVVTLVPLLPGATLRAGTFSLEPWEPGSPSTYGAVQTWSGARSIASASVHLEPTGMPSMLRPTRDGAMSRRGIGLAWRGGGAALSTLTVVDVTRAVARMRVVLDGDEVPLARLGSLGLDRLELGSHTLDLATFREAGIESATSPDLGVRRRRFDPSVAGRATHQRLGFTVTP